MGLAGVAAVAAPPLAVVVLPLALALGAVVRASQRARGNKVEAAMLADRCTDCADKLSEVVAAVDKMLQRESSTSSLSSSPVDVRVESVARSVAKLGEIMKECGAFLDAFSQKGFLSRLANGSIHAHTFALLDRRLAQQSTELGSALDLQNM